VQGGWRVEGGRWRVEAGGWRLEGGGWRVEGGGWRVDEANNAAYVPNKIKVGFAGVAAGANVFNA
jgi:hypothetical protein